MTFKPKDICNKSLKPLLPEFSMFLNNFVCYNFFSQTAFVITYTTYTHASKMSYLVMMLWYWYICEIIVYTLHVSVIRLLNSQTRIKSSTSIQY